MDLPSSLYSSLNNASNQMDGGFYQFFQEQEDPTLLPLPVSIDMASSFPMDCPNLMDLSNTFADLMATQRCELEQYLKLQNDCLRSGLLQQSKQHMASIMRVFEFKVSILLKQKEEINMVRDQVSALEECLRREMEEKETWKRIAEEKEAMAVLLSSTLERVQNLSISSVRAKIEDVGSSHVLLGEKEKQMEGAKLGFIPCKSCGSHYSCMVLVPCRHLCACKNCEASLDACPVCNSKKIDSIEISLE